MPTNDSKRRPEAYLGISYAQAPRGALRFRAPQPVEPPRELRPSKSFGAPAPQPSSLPPALRRFAGSSAPPPDEDCLSLNVWTPAADSSRRPVLVWLHGGGFTRGAGSWFVYEGEELARGGDLVVVTLNYRLGALGALNLRELDPDSDVAPNLGLRDQIAALEWVRDHITRFGGDPENVTLAGQSAGAMSIGALLQAPRARRLFHKAILQSGAASNVLSREQASDIAGRLLDELGIEARSGNAIGDALRFLPVGKLLRAQTKVSTGNRLPLGTMAWQPSYDGELLVEPQGGISIGAWHRDIPLLIGTTRDEWKMFTATDTRRRSLDDDTLHRYMARTRVGGATLGDAAAKEARGLYERCEVTGKRRQPGQIWVAFQTDRVFRQPAIALADARAEARAPTWFYRFDWQPRLARDRIGACHSLDVPFTFGTVRHPYFFPLLGWSHTAPRLSRQIQRAWAAFARSGDPGCEALPDWPAYEPERRSTLLLDRRVRCVEAPHDEARRFWRELERS